MNTVSQILERLEQGDSRAAAELLPLIYDELRRLAAAKLAQENVGQTLQGTALVHEAYLRLVGKDGAEGTAERWEHRGHFFAAAAEAMRRILVENARRKQRLKRGGDLVRVELEEIPLELPDLKEDLLALDDALTKFAAIDRQAAELIQLRYFSGLPMAEAAAVLHLAPRTAERIWAYARSWLKRELHGESDIF